MLKYHVFSLIYLSADVGMKEDIYLIGILNCLLCIFKFCYRDDLMPHVSRVLILILQMDKCPEIYCIILNLRIKLLKKLGLLLLPHHQASWLYIRKLPNIRANLERVLQPEKEANTIFQHVSPQVIDITDIPYEVSTILNEMLEALRIRDINIRWSCAKG